MPEETDNSTQEDQNVEDAEETKAVDAAVKTSNDFDKRLDNEGIEGDDEETPSADKDKSDEETTAVEETPADDETEDKPVDDAGKESDVTISVEARQVARDIGLTDEEIDSYKDDVTLKHTTDILAGVIADTESPKAAAQSPGKGQADETKDEGFKLDFKNKDDIDPEILANLEKMDAHYKEQTKGLRDQLDAVLGKIQTDETSRFVARFDERIEKLGENWLDVFGKGKTAEMSRRAPALKNRDAVRARMYAFAKGLSDQGQPVPDEGELFDLAINSLHKTKAMAVKGLKVRKATTQRAKGAISRASASRSGKLSPYDKAIETSRKFDDLIDTSE